MKKLISFLVILLLVTVCATALFGDAVTGVLSEGGGLDDQTARRGMC